MDDVVARIRSKLSAACTEPVPRRKTFARAPGGRRLGVPLSEERVCAFETRHGIRLPRGYRVFLREIGNGGIGPDCGLLPLTRWSVHDLPADVDHLGRAFGVDPAGSVADDWARQRRLPDPYGGTHQVVDRGCSEMTLLVVSGPARGRLLDADLGNLDRPPVFHPQPDFLTWYEHWLDTLPGGVLVPDFRDQLCGSSEDLVAVLTGSGSPAERSAAAYSLGGLSPLTGRARDALVAALAGDPDRGVRVNAATTLAGLDGAAAGVLASALRDPHHWVRRRALVCLFQVSNDEATYGPAVRALLQDENPYVRMLAADLLARAGWTSPGR